MGWTVCLPQMYRLKPSPTEVFGAGAFGRCGSHLPVTMTKYLRFFTFFGAGDGTLGGTHARQTLTTEPISVLLTYKKNI
jgi:hypothetical protein